MKCFILLVFSTLFLGSCATQFTGSPHIEKKMCENKCSEQNMTLSGMVFMGEYSSGCICRSANEKTSHVGNIETEQFLSAAGISAVGVILQMRKKEEERRRNQNMSY